MRAVPSFSLSLGAEVHISVDLVAQVQDAVHVADHPRKALPQLDPFGEGVVVAANPVVVRATTRERNRRWFDAERDRVVVCATKNGGTVRPEGGGRQFAWSRYYCKSGGGLP